jgi:hypothetical protein
MDFEAGYYPNALQVWRLGGAAPVLELGVETDSIDGMTGWGRPTRSGSRPTPSR